MSVHTMDKIIDGGIVISNQKVKIKKNYTIADLYEKCFDLSACVLLESLEKIRKNDLQGCDVKDFKKSYFSFPTKQHWKQFRKRNGRFI